MNTKYFAAAAMTAIVFLLPFPGQAQAALSYTDNAGNYAPATGYDGQGGSTPGFGAFKVTRNASANTFLYTATNSEVGQGGDGDAPKTIDTPATSTSKQPQSFGFYANGPAATNPSVTITRAFNVPTQSAGLATAGDTFSLDFVTGFNDGGTSGVALTNADGPVGSFVYQVGGNYLFNGKAVVAGYKNGALHLTYTLTSPTTYAFQVTGAVSYSGTGTFSSPITGFQVKQTSSAGGDPAHDGFFNNLSLKCISKTP